MDKNKKDSNIILTEIEEGEFVILSSDYVFYEVKSENVDDIVKNISSNKVNFDEIDKGKAIKIESIIEITSIQNSTSIEIKYSNNDEEYYESILVKNKKVRDKLLQSIYEHMNEDFDMSIRKETRMSSIFLPLVAIFITLVVGGFLTWLAKLAEEGIKRTRVVKAFVYYIYQILRFIGANGMMAISGVVILGCLLFIIKRLVVPPTMDVITRREVA